MQPESMLDLDPIASQYFEKFSDGEQTYMTVPEPTFILNPTDNVKVSKHTIIDGVPVIEVSRRTVRISTFSDTGQLGDPSTSYGRYVSEFLTKNPELKGYIANTYLPPSAFFAVDLERTNKLICLIPTL